MPVQYNPTDSRFLTVAQSRTNNGQKDIRIILDIPTNDFYSLDDDGNFNIIGGAGTITLEQVLNQGNSTGGLSITSPDGLTVLDVADTSLNTQISDGGNYEHMTVMQSFDYNRTLTDLNTSNSAIVSIATDSMSFQIVDTVNRVNSNLYMDNTKVELNYLDDILSYDNKVQITKDDIKLIYDNIGGALNYEFLLADNGFYLKNLPAYADETAASGLPAGYLYQTDGTGASPLDVAGILMIKQ